MEDISHILDNGEIPELFTKEEKGKFVEEMENNLITEKYKEMQITEEE